MIFPIRPTTTETRRVDDVNVRATPAVTGITAAHGFNQPGVVVTIGDGARTLARSGQQQESGNSSPNPRASGASEESTKESVFGGKPSKANVEAVFNDQQGKTLPAAEDESERVGGEESEPSDVAGEGGFQSVWGSEAPTDEVNAKGVPYAALQRAASVQDLDVGDVAKALAHTQIAVRVLATVPERPGVSELGDDAPIGEANVGDDVEVSRLSSVPTDGVPYEALQRAVTEAENAQSLEASADSLDAEGQPGDALSANDREAAAQGSDARSVGEQSVDSQGLVARGVDGQGAANQSVDASGRTAPPSTVEAAPQLEAPNAGKSPTEPVFMPPENGGAPWGRAVPFEDESKRSVSAERVPAPRQERGSEAQPSV